MPRRINLDPSLPQADTSIAAIKYLAKRKNIPPAGLEAQGALQKTPRLRHEYNPHLPPVLRFSNSPAEADKLPELLAIARQRALSDEAARTLGIPTPTSPTCATGWPLQQSRRVSSERRGARRFIAGIERNAKLRRGATRDSWPTPTRL